MPNPHVTDVQSPVPLRRQRYRLRPPSRMLRPLEARALLEFGSLFPSAPKLAAEPRGDGRKVVLLPGFLADDRSTWPLSQYLSFLGYDSRGWGLGLNRGNPETDAERFIERMVDSLPAGEKLTLIGWSLGGVIARVTAMRRPEAVREIITMGTPVEGGPKYTTAGAYYARQQGLDLDAFEEHVHSQNQNSLDVPITVIYSRTDGVVGWRAAIDRYNAQAKHVEVPGS
ncbi:MAG: alpha/beta hydrolase, partial [Myxococcota bacterium]